MFRTFDRAGVQFMYPENWVLVDDTREDAIVDVSVQSPGSCLWMLQVLSAGPSLREVANEVIRSLRDSYPDLESSEIECDVAGHSCAAFDVNFFCLDFLVQCGVRVFAAGDRIGAVVYQAELREFIDNEQVFLAITTSWLQHVSGSTIPTSE